MNKVVVAAFDFDGVLAIPYSHPERLFPGAEPLLRSLHAQGVIVLVASFNPRAYVALRHLLDEGVIRGIRAGSLVEWWKEGDGTYSDARHRKNMNKALHLSDMLARELDGVDVSSVTFYDDDRDNIHDVMAGSYGRDVGVEGLFVPWYAGFGGDALGRSTYLAAYYKHATQ